MPNLSQEDIRIRAYELWRAAGEPNGDMEAFWFEAEKQLLAERSQADELPPGMTDNLPVYEQSGRVAIAPRAFEQRAVNVWRAGRSCFPADL
ncbi:MULTISPECIES: DUF2934 domain-containing protein [Bradyrhizobium]|jgi:hypothetical protein|uniref:DUF2934 domain-containing protein n=2 Tax=Bradyrhizobium TaxID=374 RepID=UPI0007C8E56C|nr:MULTISPECIES: DUF2934 domain-containing protein [Bradyrhizobium]WFT98818.1 DUF2934 domain-containing protein [Bradyrhizobium barranii]